MLRFGILLVLPVLGACEAEPSFDERYQDTRQQIGDKAGKLDQQLEKPPASDAGESDKEPDAGEDGTGRE
jgi:hypothetical protein